MFLKVLWRRNCVRKSSLLILIHWTDDPILHAAKAEAKGSLSWVAGWNPFHGIYVSLRFSVLWSNNKGHSAGAIISIIPHVQKKNLVPNDTASHPALIISDLAFVVNCVSGKTGVNVWSNPWTQQVIRSLYSSITHTIEWFMVPSCTCCLSAPRPYIRCKDRIKYTCWIYYSCLSRKWGN
jgi:hypothetical protein